MQAKAKRRKPRSDTYSKVFDSRKHRVRGMWIRNGRFFGNVTISDDLGRKSSKMVPLKGATFEGARDDYRRLQVERDEDRLRPIGQSPTLGEYVEKSYKRQLKLSGKRPTTISKEGGYVKYWQAKLGHLRLNKIRTHHLKEVLTKLAEAKYSPRSINLYLIAVRGVLKAALHDGHIKPPLPFEGLAWQRVDTKKRQLYTPTEIDQLCEVALQASKNGREFVDYIRFLQYSGARMREGLAVRWRAVDLERHQLTLGAEGDAKNRTPRVVDFNPALEAHLQGMATRRQPDSEWLFPSPQRGDRDIPAKTFRESLQLTRDASGVKCLNRKCGKLTVGTRVKKCLHCKSKRLEPVEHLLPTKLRVFGFHDCRHHFISYAVMSCVDFMTVAKWCGHRDGGVLIGKVYGHLADEHRKHMAQQVNFGPRIVVVPEPSSQAKSATSS